ncbi:MAG: ribosome recycling factor [Chloroflexi bacterium]|nr:ribosome recycling factor [Chloroflexota bacterium]
MIDVVGEILKEAESKMSKAVEALKRELGGIRTGRASPGLVDRVMVEYYGTPTPLTQLATISVPDPRVLMIQPWEQHLMSQIEKAILKSDLGLTPTNDGRAIRLVMPPLSEERRHDLVRLARRRVEEGRVAIRNCRRDATEQLRHREREKALPEDAFHKAQERLQKLTDQFIEEADRLGSLKEKEILEQ